MKHEVYFGIALRIIIIFGVGMLWTFINPELREFLGDVHEVDKNSPFDEEWTWGVRHYWYFWMMFCLFMLSLINTIISIGKLVNKHYPGTF